MSPYLPEEEVRRIRQANPPLMLLDNTFVLQQQVPVTSLNLRRWDLQMGASDFASFDRSFFLQLLVRCEEAAQSLENPRLALVLYDCR